LIGEGVQMGNGQVVVTFTPPAPPPAKPKPNTHIRKKPGKHKHKRRGKTQKSTFRFDDDLPGVTFYCSLDDADPGPCTSPKVYRHLKRGKHTFSVYSVDALGTQSLPQTTKFRVRG
jgi:hypothetical protein